MEHWCLGACLTSAIAWPKKPSPSASTPSTLSIWPIAMIRPVPSKNPLSTGSERNSDRMPRLRDTCDEQDHPDDHGQENGE